MRMIEVRRQQFYADLGNKEITASQTAGANDITRSFLMTGGGLLHLIGKLRRAVQKRHHHHQLWTSESLRLDEDHSVSHEILLTWMPDAKSGSSSTNHSFCG